MAGKMDGWMDRSIDQSGALEEEWCDETGRWTLFPNGRSWVSTSKIIPSIDKHHDSVRIEKR